MALNYISWNVIGLEASNRKYVVKRLLNSHRELDFMLLQEVKAVGFDLDIALRCIWRDATYKFLFVILVFYELIINDKYNYSNIVFIYNIFL